MKNMNNKVSTRRLLLAIALLLSAAGIFLSF
jgi:hypothetical protein